MARFELGQVARRRHPVAQRAGLNTPARIAPRACGVVSGSTAAAFARIRPISV